MFIEIFIMLSMAYYIVKLIQPEFYSEMFLKDILDRNKDCKDINDLKEKCLRGGNVKDVLKDLLKLALLLIFCLVHMLLEFSIIILIILKYKNIAAIFYLVFWLCIYIKGKKDNKKYRDKYKNEFDRIRVSLNNCYKKSERMIILVDIVFFIYMFYYII